MNRIYRLVWSKTRRMLVAVAEITPARAKGGSARQRRRAPARLISATGRVAPLIMSDRPPTVRRSIRPVARVLAVLGSLLGLPVSAFALPSGGQIVAGQASINHSGSTLNVHQESDKTILNWNSFSITSGETVNFYQPGATGIALNRVVGSDPSSIYGHLNANGQVFLVNPNGVYFAPGARVNVGGIVASTLGIDNSDFLNGNYHFSGDSTASVVNDGRITAAQAGYVAFIGDHVVNNGRITTPGGATALGAGGSIDLTLAGNSLLSFKVSSATLNALAGNGGVIQADGGTVVLSAQARDALLKTVVNNTGVIQAQTVQNHNGTIELLGGHSGTTRLAGTLDASAPNGGDGGQIETSGAHLKVADGTTITTQAPQGSDGNWLIDPYDFTIAASGGDITGSVLSTTLDSGSVTIQTTGSGVSCTGVAGCGTGNSAGNGDIFVDDTVGWSANTLTLSAYRNIVINTTMNGSGTAKLALQYGQGSANGTIGGTVADYIDNAPVNLPAGQNFSTRLGTGGTTVTYTVITALGSPGDATTAPGTMTLQGMNAALSGHYVLGADIDASPTATWNPAGSGGYYGFTPVGASTANAFTGTFGGLGHTISGLTEYQDNGSDFLGLFGVTQGGVIRDIGLVGVSITENIAEHIGGLVGANVSDTISNAYVTGNVSAYGIVGGLVGNNDANGTITNSYAAGNVSGTLDTGGLVGSNVGTITNAYAAGNVNSASDSAGGLVGLNGSSGTITNAYATGNVNSSGSYAGGLVGTNIGAITNAHATGNVKGVGSYVGGLLGENYGGTVTNAYATGSVHGHGNVGGLVGFNDSNASISAAYATGSVSGDSGVGGLVGGNHYGTITGAYAAGSVTGTNKVGGLVGSNSNGTITDGYWDTTTTGMGTNSGIGVNNNGTVNGGSGLTDTRMMQQASFNGFDFINTWIIYDGHTYPLLRSFMTPLTVTAGAQTRTYDRSTFILSNPTYTVAGADTSGHLFGLDYNGAVNVGTYSADLWSDQQGYIINQTGVGSLTIIPKALSLSGLSVANKVYDGTTAATITGYGTLDGVVPGDKVSLDTAAISANFADPYIGYDKPVRFNGPAVDNSNYTLPYSTLVTTASILLPDESGSSGLARRTVQDGYPSPTAGPSIQLDPVASGQLVQGNNLKDLVLLQVKNGGVSLPARPCTGSAAFGAFFGSGAPSGLCGGGSRL